MCAASVPADVWGIVFEYIGELRFIIRAWIELKLTKIVNRSHNIWQALLEVSCNRYNVDIQTLLVNIYSFSSASKYDYIDIFAKMHTMKKCSRSGCFKMFNEATNSTECCYYHPGKLRTAGYSTSCLTCCRSKSFSAPGCRRGRHEGAFYSFVYSKREEKPLVESALTSATSSSGTESLKLPSIVAPSSVQVDDKRVKSRSSSKSTNDTFPAIALARRL